MPFKKYLEDKLRAALTKMYHEGLIESVPEDMGVRRNRARDFAIRGDYTSDVAFRARYRI